MKAPEKPRSAVPAGLIHPDLASQQVVHHRRHQRSRQQVRRHHREHHRHRQRREQVLRRTRQQQHRHEHDADGQRGDERRHGNLRCAVQNRVHQRLPHRHVAMRVLDLHRRIVHQDADGERQPAERHHVDRLAEQTEDRDRRQDRQRNRDADDQRAAPAAEKQQDHEARQQRRDQRLADDAADGRPHEQRLIAEDRQLQVLRDRGHDPGQRVLHRVDDGQRGRPAVARDGQQHPARPVRADDVGLRNEAVVNRGDVFEVDRRAVDRLDRQVVERRDAGQAAVQADGIFGPRELRRARRHDQVLKVQGVRHVNRRQALGVQLVEVQVHHDLTVLAAERIRHRRALHGGERRADEVVPEVEDFLLGERLAAQPELENRHARRVVLQDLRRERARRHVADLDLALRHDLRQCEVHLYGRVEEHTDDGDALMRLRFNVLDADHVRRQRPLEVGDDPALHFLRRQAVVLPDDADDREVDVGKDVDRHRRDRETAQDGDQQSHDDEGIRAPEGEPDDPHGSSPDCANRAAPQFMREAG